MDFSGWKAGPTQAVLPLVGLAAEKVIRDRYSLRTWLIRLRRRRIGSGRACALGGETHSNW
ncbi:MAG: hypothetical protein R6U98_03170, partial [Pirellulaceae bacterium]